MNATLRHAALAAALTLAAGGPALAQMKNAIGAGEGMVDIVAWPGYIERGNTDPNFDRDADGRSQPRSDGRFRTNARLDPDAGSDPGRGSHAGAHCRGHGKPNVDSNRHAGSGRDSNPNADPH